MCTVSWMLRKSGYDFFFNRDELNSRARAHGPALREQSGVQYVSCEDAHAGGTWLGVNEYGITAGVLNYYPDDTKEPAGGYTSRGRMVMGLQDCKAQEECFERMSRMDLSTYRPFLLILFAPDKPLATGLWDGQSFAGNRGPDLQPPLTTSSYENDAVTESRKMVYKEFFKDHRLNSINAINYHRSHIPEKGAQSVCMHRSEASTVSFSYITVESHSVLYAYWPDAPCKLSTFQEVELERKI